MFVEYDTPPEPVGGFHAIQQNLVYPEQPRKAGIQGTVTVQAKIGEDGTVIDTKILMSLDEFCDQAAINSIKAVDWIPATTENRYQYGYQFPFALNLSNLKIIILLKGDFILCLIKLK